MSDGVLTEAQTIALDQANGRRTTKKTSDGVGTGVRLQDAGEIGVDVDGRGDVDRGAKATAQGFRFCGCKSLHRIGVKEKSCRPDLLLFIRVTILRP